METLFSIAAKVTFLLRRTNETLLETTDIGEINKIFPDGFEYDPIAEGTPLLIDEISYTVNAIAIFSKGMCELKEPDVNQIGTNFPFSVQIVIYLDEKLHQK